MLKKLVSHLSFPLFAPLLPPSYRDNPTPNTPVTHPRRPPEADEARFRFSPPLYFCAVFQSQATGAHMEHAEKTANKSLTLKNRKEQTMAKIFGVNTKISGKVGQLLYRQTKRGTIVSELPVKPAIPRRSARQMDRRTQWGNLAAIYKQFDSMLRRGYENLPPQMSVFNAFIQANIDVVKVYITKTIRLCYGCELR